MRSTGRRKVDAGRRSLGMAEDAICPWYPRASMTSEESRKVLHRLQKELAAGGREREAAALDELLGGGGEPVFLKLRKRGYTPAEVAERVGVSRQTVVKWIERGELDAELTPG